MELAFGCLVAFLIGAVPWALLMVRVVKGVDVRKVGSGNVGATNAARAFSTRSGQLLAFVAIYLLDAAKGYVPTLIAAGDGYAVAVYIGAAAVLGHVFSPFLRFAGGKGVATATGVLLALDPAAVGIAIGVFLVIRLITGQVFLGSLALGLTLAGGAIALHLDSAFDARLPVTILCLLLAVLMFWTHRSNLKKHFAATAAGKS